MTLVLYYYIIGSLLQYDVLTYKENFNVVVGQNRTNLNNFKYFCVV